MRKEESSLRSSRAWEICKPRDNRIFSSYWRLMPEGRVLQIFKCGRSELQFVMSARITTGQAMVSGNIRKPCIYSH